MKIIYLLAFPVGLMGLVHLVFTLLSILPFHNQVAAHFLTPALAELALAVLFYRLGRNEALNSALPRDALAFATSTWVIMGFLGAIPIANLTDATFTDALFESISGLTTTGATILSGLDTLPASFLLYRQFLQWLGGLGMVIFVVAVLPVLNVGGMKLLKAEMPGPIKDEKLSPRISRATHYLWFVYVALTLLCALCYYFAGMSPYDAIAHSLTTISTGGFSTHDASLGFFQSPLILAVADIFMLLGAISFALHYRVWHVWRRPSPAMYFREEETRTFLWLALILSLVIFVFLTTEAIYTTSTETLSQSIFHLISFMTSTGFGASNYTEWPDTVVFLLVFASYLGGCAGSTAGGNKIIRNILTVKLVHLEMKRLLHPRGIFKVRFQNQPVEQRIVQATFAFMCMAACSSMFFTLLMMATGLDFWTAFTAVAACLNVLGPAFGELGSNFQPVSGTGTWLLSFIMIVGRLEYFTVFALLTPSFWRR